MENREDQTFSVPPEDVGQRLDRYVSLRLVDCTRSYAAALIRKGHIQVDGACTKPSHKVKVKERISIHIPPPAPVDLIPEPIALDILFEDRHLIVVNKPPGLVVHPAAGHATGTLVNGILHHCPNLAGIGGEMRPGIVHRLDKDTSGLIVVAKNTRTLMGLAQQFKGRVVSKQYLALVHGIPKQPSGSIALPVGRHPVHRKKMSTMSPRGREALTLWQIKEKLKYAALLAIDLKTGRTHQIRVHCQSIGHPIVGDSLYGSRKRWTHIARKELSVYQAFEKAERQMLHAHRLCFFHPETAEEHRFEAPISEDMQRILKELKR